MTDGHERRDRLFDEHGGAMVELVVLMLVFVPLVMLPLYFEDSIQYKLNAQEAVFSTVWDFAYGDYSTKTVSSLKGKIESDNKSIFANGLSGNKKAKHDPSGPWANFRWTNDKPVQCSLKETGFQAPPALVPLGNTFYRAFSQNKGGLVECHGSVDVENYYIPHIFLPELSGRKNGEFFQEQKQWVHFDEGGNDYSFGLLVDPWTISDPSDVKQGKGNKPFMKRVKHCWGDLTGGTASASAVTWGVFSAFWGKYIAKAIQNKVILAGGAFDVPPLGKLQVKHLADKKQSVPTAFGQDKLYATPWLDGKQNTYKKTFSARGNYYLGCKRLEPNCSGK